VHGRYHMGQIWHSDALDPECESQLFSFPEARHDDVVDATTYAIGSLIRLIRTDWSERRGGNQWSQWGGAGGELPHEVIQRQAEKSARMMDRFEEEALEKERMPKWEIRELPNGRTYLELVTPSDDPDEEKPKADPSTTPPEYARAGLKFNR
jgi:hypothetical protein